MVHTKSLDWGVMGDTWVSGQPCIHHGGREVGKREKRSDWPTWMMFPPQTNPHGLQAVREEDAKGISQLVGTGSIVYA